MSHRHFFTICADCGKTEPNESGLCKECELLPQYADGKDEGE